MKRTNQISAPRRSQSWILAGLLVLAGGSSLSAQTFLEYPIPPSGSNNGPIGITGPDGSGVELFAASNTNSIGFVVPGSFSGSNVFYTACIGPDPSSPCPITQTNNVPFGIALGPPLTDVNTAWFTEYGTNQIAQMAYSPDPTPGIPYNVFSVTFNQFTIPTPNSIPYAIVQGPDGAFWFTEWAGNKIGRITTGGAFTEYPIPTANSQPTGITVGPDGALWFTESGTGKIGRITTSGAFTEFVVPSMNSGPTSITLGPDNALWFTESGANKIGSVTTSGTFAEYPIPTSSSQPTGITVGPDNALWFTEQMANQIGRITTSLNPQPGWISEYAGLTSGSQPFGISSVTNNENLPNGGLMFTEFNGNNIGVLLPFEFPLNPGPCTLGSGLVGFAYSTGSCSPGNTAGGTSPYNLSATGLPSTLSLSSGGAITGTPTTAGTYTVTITESDSTESECNFTEGCNQQASQVLILHIFNPLTLTCGAAPPAEIGVAYSATPCTASNGVPPYTYSISDFPPGLTINASTGLITGTPTSGAVNSSTVTVTDSLTPAVETANQPVTVTVYPQLLLSCTAGTAGFVGTPYSSTPCGAGGGDTPLIYTATGLPPGLAINAANGAITGTPTTAGIYNSVIVTVTDSLTPTAQAVSEGISITINGQLNLTCSATVAGVVGVAYSSSPCAAGGGTAPYAYSASGLPPGLSINASSGAITGMPTATGVYNQGVVVVTDNSTPSHQAATHIISITIYAKLTLSCVAGTPGAIGTAYSSSPCTAGGGDTPLSYTATGLPPNLTINAATGAITGTPTTAGVYNNAIITVTDSLAPTAQTAAQTISITITGQLTLTCSAGVGGIVGVAYNSSPCAGSGGVPSYTYSANGLPPVLSINANTGAITGTPTTAAVYSNVIVTVTDSSTPTHQTASHTISITITGQLTLTCSAGVGGIVGVAYNSSPCAGSSGVQAYTYSATGLPPVLSINANTGAITGTPTTAAVYSNVIVTVTDSSTPTHQTASRTISITINGAVNLTCGAGVSGSVGVAYNSSPCVGSSGLPPYTYSASGLPPGLSISPTTGAITGTPTTGGVYTNVIVTVTDISVPTDQRSQTIVIAITSRLTLSCQGATTYVGVAFSGACSASGGVTPYHWTASGLPQGLSINPTSGQITGISTVGGAYSATVTVTDSTTPASQTASQQFAFTSISRLTVNCGAAAPGTTGVAYSAAPCSITGGTTPYSWTANGLPAGLSINPGSGAINGTPTAAGTYAVGVSVNDSSPSPQSGSQGLTIVINAPQLTLTCASAPQGVVATTYSATPCPASGGTPPYTYSASGLPPGLSINSATGAITGTPTTANSYSGSITAADSGALAKQTASQPITIVIAPGKLGLTCSAPPAGMVATGYSATPCPASGGTLPYAYSASGLPPGLSINPGTGAITGTPTTASSYTGSVTVTDSSTPTKQSVAQPISIVINPGTLSLTCGSTPQGVIAASYAATPCLASGGTTPYAYSASGLPAGLSINPATGAITGTPTSAGIYSGSVTVTDNGAPTRQSATQPISIVINPTPLSVTCGSAPQGVIATSYSASPCSASGGTTPYAYSGSGLPPGLSINPSTGALTGTPTTADPYTVTLTVTDSSQPKQTQNGSFTVSILPGVTINSLNLVISSTTSAPQSSVTLTLASPSADPLTGVLCMIFQPNSAVVLPPAGINPYDASLANANASLLKQCPQGSISAISFTLGPSDPDTKTLTTISPGTVAGQISLEIVSLLDSNTSVLPAQNTSVSLTIPAAVPQITSPPVIGAIVNGVFTVSLNGYTSTRQLTEADFTFTPGTAGGTTLNNGSAPVTIPVLINNADQTQFFQTPAAAGYGGSFSLTVSFPYTGDSNALGTVSVTLKNSQSH